MEENSFIYKRIISVFIIFDANFYYEHEDGICNYTYFIEMLLPFQFTLMGFKAAELSNGDLMIKDYKRIWQFRNMKMELLYENNATVQSRDFQSLTVR